MNFRTASLIALTVSLLVGIMFFTLSFNLPMSSPGVVIGPGYYPRSLSLLLIVSSMIGLYTNYRRAASKNIIVDIPKPVYFFFVIGLALLVAGVWHITHRFYPIAVLATFLLLWFLNPEPSTTRKAVKTLLVGSVILGVIFLLFSVLLQLSL